MFTITIVTLSLIFVVGGAVAYAMKLRHELKLRELELRQTELLTGKVRDPALPAYVDPEDQASMDAWRQTQTEMDKAW